MTITEEKLDKNLIKNYYDGTKVLYNKLYNESSGTFKILGGSIKNNFLPKESIDFNLKLYLKPELKDGEKRISDTLSICPECYSLLHAIIYEKNGKVWIKKTCPDHGEFEELYWGDYDFYIRSSKQSREGRGIENPSVEIINACPYNCGLCPRHKSHTALLNLVVTNRCNMGCWYCFFFAERAGYVYEPTFEHLKFMLKTARETRPIPALAVQITGGEPTLRDDIVDIVKMAKSLGYQHIQINTEGIRVAFDPELSFKLREAGVNTYYMSFDGVTPFTNPKNHWEIPYALENSWKAGIGVVLVPTILKSVNDHEVGSIINFGLKHNYVVRGINFQPVSLVGRMSKQEREKYRITIPDILKKIEEQTDGMIKLEDWYTVPFTIPLSRFVEAITNKRQFEMTNHFACGVATYIFQDRETGEITPITRFIDVVSLFEYFDKKSQEINNGKSRKLVLIETLLKINKFIDWKNVPRRLRRFRKLYWILYKILIKHDYKALGEFHLNSLFIGMMHFMDPYNYDIARVQRCDIHYIMPDGRIVPFCTFNVLPHYYRDRMQKVYSISIKEYLKIKGLRSLAQEKYVRNIRKLESGEIYRKYYTGFYNPESTDYETKKELSIKFGIPVVD